MINMSKPYRIGTKVKVGKTQEGSIRDFITDLSGRRYYKVYIYGKGFRIVAASKIRRI